VSKFNLVNDNGCGWLNQLPKRINIKILNKDLISDYLIVGAGYTGLSAARKLSEIDSSKKIIIIDAQLAGEGASSRNSGYLVDTTLNDGFTSNKDLQNYNNKVKIYDLGIKAVRRYVKEYQVDCDWNDSGKYFASSKLEDKNRAKSFANLLTNLNFKNKILYKDELKKKLGTSFYNIAVYTNGGILLNPAKLARSMVDTLSENVELYENTQLLNWKKINNKIECQFSKNKIITNNIIFCTNGFLGSLNVRKNYSFPITLTASMTRPLNDKEFHSIGSPQEWGVLPIRPMGATIRLTKDKRILIRNTAEVRNPNLMNEEDLKERVKLHTLGIKKRFPNLPDNLIENSWSGIVCRSGNGSQIFEKIDKNIYAAGCYNGSGIGVGTFFGEQIALKVFNQQTDEISVIEERKKPNWLLPQPLLNIGIYTRLTYERIKARSET
jgi:glycine/D-amino acid oxidase-like deaminating enzyme|tara:strand:+ start:335 stop:1648 length:1314 start_codon:yes stop_codon:yes gene_type:complete